MHTDMAQITAKVSEIRLRNAEAVLERLGLNVEDALNLMLVQIDLRQGLPFELSLAAVTQPLPKLLSSEEQVSEWCEALGDY